MHWGCSSVGARVVRSVKPDRSCSDSQAAAVSKHSYPNSARWTQLKQTHVRLAAAATGAGGATP
jgi:hypothetical protein